MTPRLKSSHKWTPLPPELCEQVTAVCTESFPTLSSRGTFLVEGRIYSGELMVRIGFLEKGRLAQANFEVSLDFDPNKQNALEAIHFAIDCAASMIQDYVAIEEDLQEFPREWKSFDVEGKKVFLQVSTVNPKLEAEADRLLGIYTDDLVQGDDDETELKAKITMLGLDDEKEYPDADESESEESESDESGDPDGEEPPPGGYKH